MRLVGALGGQAADHLAVGLVQGIGRERLVVPEEVHQRGVVADPQHHVLDVGDRAALVGDVPAVDLLRHHHPVLVGDVVELVGLPDREALRAQHVEAGVGRVAHQRVVPALGQTKEHVGRHPRPAPNQHPAAVDHVVAPAVLVDLRRGLAHPEPRLQLIGQAAGHARLEGEVVERLPAEARRPPDSRLLEAQTVTVGAVAGRELDLLAGARGELDVLAEPTSLEARLDGRGLGTVRHVAGEDGDREVGGLEARQVEIGHDVGVIDPYGAGGPHEDVLPQAHVHVGREGVVVVPASRRLDLLGLVGQLLQQTRRDHLDGEGVAGPRLQVVGHRELEALEHPRRLIPRGDPLSVEPHVGLVVDAVEVEAQVLAGPGLGDVELDPIPPGIPERAVLGHDEPRRLLVARGPGEVVAVVRVGQLTRLDERREDGRGHPGRVPPRGVDARPRKRGTVCVDLGRGLDGPSLDQRLNLARRDRARREDGQERRQKNGSEKHDVPFPGRASGEPAQPPYRVDLRNFSTTRPSSFVMRAPLVNSSSASSLRFFSRSIAS